MVKDAYKFAVPPILAGATCLFFGWKFPAAVFIVLGGFIFYFFSPSRALDPADPATIVSPADGKVVEIISEDLDSRSGRRISIFLSIWNVHVQRAPVAGRIAEVMYRPGRFYGAYRARASGENEQNIIYITRHRAIGLQTNRRSHRTARAMLERKGEMVARGERVGLIRFGSRVDIWLPVAAEISSSVGKGERRRKYSGKMDFNNIDPIGPEEAPARPYAAIDCAAAFTSSPACSRWQTFSVATTPF